jgi:hypothetical protein
VSRRFSNDWPVAVQGLGLVALAWGFGLLAVWAGVVVGGAGLIVSGMVAELGKGE